MLQFKIRDHVLRVSHCCHIHDHVCLFARDILSKGYYKLCELSVPLVTRLIFNIIDLIQSYTLLKIYHMFDCIPDIRRNKIYVNQDFQTLCFVCMVIIAMGFGITIFLPASIYVSAKEMCMEQLLVTYYFGDLGNFWTYGVVFLIHLITAVLQTVNIICSATILMFECGSMSVGFRQAW